MDDKQSPLQRPMTYLHGLVMATLLVLGIVFIPQFITTGRVEQYQYDNIRVQKNLVDRSLIPIETDIVQLKDRVEISESKINAQLRETDRVTRKLEDLMYQASPQDMARMLRERSGQSINQTASPTINVSPTYNK